MFFHSVLLTATVFGVVDCAKFIPDYIKICKHDEPKLNECYRNSFKQAVKHMNEGIPEMNLRKIDPLVVDKLSMDYGNGTAVSFSAVIDDLKMYGFPETEPVDAEVDLEKLTWKLTMHVKHIYMLGRFRARGRVLLLMFDSDGSFNGNISGIVCNGTWQGRKVEKNGEEHVKFVKSDVDLKMAEVQIHFENLFPSREINDRMNEVINENIDVFYDELKPIFINTIKTIIIDSVNSVYNTFPFAKLFPK